MDNRIEIRPGRIINVTIYKSQANTKTAFLIHGLGGQGTQWREQINILKNKYTLIIPDLLGHGKSAKPTRSNANNPYSFLEFKEDLKAVFTNFATNENIVMGHSYGGALAASLTLEHQDKIKKLILISPTACKPAMQVPFFYTFPSFILTLLRPWLEKKFEQSSFAPGANPKLLAEELQAGKVNRMDVIKATVNGMKTIPQTDISKLHTSTLIIFGKEDTLIPIIDIQAFYQALPQHKFEKIDHASHMVMLEQPAQVNKHLLDFLELIR